MLAAAWLSAMVPAAAEKEFFDRARLLLFDKKWSQALTELERIIKSYPDSQYYPPALFYKAKCREELRQWDGALKTYTAYIVLSRSGSLKEEAQIGVINAAFQLYQAGQKQYFKKITAFMESRNLTLRYYAAFKLSYLEDKQLARRAVPVLKAVIANEADEDLVNRAKIALMRIDPGYLKDVSKRRGLELASLKIQIYDKQTKKVTTSISIPFGLARLALDALPKKEKAELREEGYDLDRILESLVKSGDILKIDGEEQVFRLWVE
jgi:tetratricopeptide (TPR) repeat protein